MEERSQPGSSAYRSFLSIRSARGRQEEQPRPLTDDERSVIDAAIAPVLHDLRAADAILPEIRYEAWDRGADDVCAMELAG